MGLGLSWMTVWDLFLLLSMGGIETLRGSTLPCAQVYPGHSIHETHEGLHELLAGTRGQRAPELIQNIYLRKMNIYLGLG